ncbi:MAG: hypothetical protein PHO14_01730, partial [Kiritimatiellae bacterium]|nr:hypothetical protein [Kiritimatiellia bacterium]
RVTWSSVLRRNRVGLYEWKSERQVIEIHQDTLAAGASRGTGALPWMPRVSTCWPRWNRRRAPPRG